MSRAALRGLGKGTRRRGRGESFREDEVSAKTRKSLTEVCSIFGGKVDDKKRRGEERGKNCSRRGPTCSGLPTLPPATSCREAMRVVGGGSAGRGGKAVFSVGNCSGDVVDGGVITYCAPLALDAGRPHPCLAPHSRDGQIFALLSGTVVVVHR